MARGYRRKCKCCLKFFRPDPCNRRHQRYLRGSPLQTRQQGCEPSSLARQTREPGLLPRPVARRPRLAVAQSRLLAQGATPCNCVTRRLNGAIR